MSFKKMRQSAKSLINGLSVGQKVMTVIIVEVISYSVITMIALSQIHVVGNEVKQMANLYLPLFSATESVRQQVQNERLNLKEVIFVGDRVVYDKKSEESYIAARARFLEASSRINDWIASSVELIETSISSSDNSESIIKTFQPKLIDQLAKIRYANRLNNRRVEKIFQHVEDGSFLMGMELLDGVVASEKALTAELDILVSYLLELKTASVDYSIRVETNSSDMILLASFMTFCVVIAVFFIIVKRNISRPLHALTDAINSFDALKDLSDSSTEKELMSRGDELGMVARSFNALKHDLREQGKALRLAKETAEKADNAKSQFLAAASHDLRQPLHAMQMYLAVLRRRLKISKNLEIVSNVEAVAITTGRLLNSLLEISQLEAGVISPQIEDFPIKELTRRLALSFLPIAQNKGLSLRIIASNAIVRSDPALLERVVGNFLSNAIRYTDKGSILIGCRKRGNKLAIQVWDTGPGIPGNQAQAIFDDFHQLYNEERDKGKGLGLGLAIARRLSDCLNHEIEHRSVLGKGSYFGVLVDVGDRVNERAQQENFSEISHDLSQAVVLLIEDDKSVVEATTLLLKSWGSKVFCARTANEAVEIISAQTQPPNIIIADYRLPGELDGIEAVTRVQLAVGTAIPAIIITGESKLNEIQKMSEMGYLVLRKPVRPAKLRSLINHFLSQNTETRG